MNNKIIDLYKEYSDNVKGFVELIKNDESNKPETLFILSMQGFSSEQLSQWFDLSKTRINELISQHKKTFFKSYFENTLYLQIMLKGGINQFNNLKKKIFSLDREKLKSKEIILERLDDLMNIEKNIYNRQTKFMGEFNKSLDTFMREKLNVIDSNEINNIFNNHCKPLFNHIILSKE